MSGCRCCRPSAPAGCEGSVPGAVAPVGRGARFGDEHRQRAGRHALVHAHHHLVPDLGGQAAAGHAGQGRVVVVSHPDARHVIGGEADEPGIARGLGRAGLACHLPVDRGAPVCRCRPRPPGSSCRSVQAPPVPRSRARPSRLPGPSAGSRRPAGAGRSGHRAAPPNRRSGCPHRPPSCRSASLRRRRGPARGLRRDRFSGRTCWRSRARGRGPPPRTRGRRECCGDSARALVRVIMP